MKIFLVYSGYNSGEPSWFDAAFTILDLAKAFICLKEDPADSYVLEYRLDSQLSAAESSVVYFYTQEKRRLCKTS